jgi:phage FluMu protein Com
MEIEVQCQRCTTYFEACTLESEYVEVDCPECGEVFEVEILPEKEGT